MAMAATMLPPASPGIAASQKSCEVVRSKPIAGSRTTSAETTNQTMNAMIRFSVVIVSVRHARRLPAVSQKPASSGRQSESQDSLVGGACAEVVLISAYPFQARAPWARRAPMIVGVCSMRRAR